jgi:hypothetical protein
MHDHHSPALVLALLQSRLDVLKAQCTGLDKRTDLSADAKDRQQAALLSKLNALATDWDQHLSQSDRRLA